MNTLEKIAVLIDADNTQLKKLELVFQEVSTHGRIVVKRAYGNWRKDSLKNWEDELKRLAIKAQQQFDYVSGKNATDMALVIDAIELLHSEIYDCFVLVSSDSDFTPLAIKLHETGVYVIGVGEKKTAESFRNSCDEFVFIENLEEVQITADETDEIDESEDSSATKKSGRRSAKSSKNSSGKDSDLNGSVDLKAIHALLHKAWETYQDEDGYVNIGAAGSYLKRAKSDFDVRSYGYSKLPELIEAHPKKYKIKKYRGKGTTTIVAYECV